MFKIISRRENVWRYCWCLIEQSERRYIVCLCMVKHYIVNRSDDLDGQSEWIILTTYKAKDEIYCQFNNDFLTI